MVSGRTCVFAGTSENVFFAPASNFSLLAYEVSAHEVRRGGGYRLHACGPYCSGTRSLVLCSIVRDN